MFEFYVFFFNSPYTLSIVQVSRPPPPRSPKRQQQFSIQCHSTTSHAKLPECALAMCSMARDGPKRFARGLLLDARRWRCYFRKNWHIFIAIYLDPGVSNIVVTKSVYSVTLFTCALSCLHAVLSRLHAHAALSRLSPLVMRVMSYPACLPQKYCTVCILMKGRRMMRSRTY